MKQKYLIERAWSLANASLAVSDPIYGSHCPTMQKCSNITRLYTSLSNTDGLIATEIELFWACSLIRFKFLAILCFSFSVLSVSFLTTTTLQSDYCTCIEIQSITWHLFFLEWLLVEFVFLNGLICSVDSALSIPGTQRCWSRRGIHGKVN